MTDYHFSGQLTARDAKRWIALPFRVPAGARRLDLRLEYAPGRVHGIANLVTLSLFDPAGFRGARLREATLHQAHLDAGAASPGFLPGPLPPGEWIAQLDTHMIMPGEPLRYTLDIVVSDAETRRHGDTGTDDAEIRRRGDAGKEDAETGRHGDAEIGHPVSASPPHRVSGWYRGDLHTHTHHSDGGERTVAGLVDAARGAGLDFVFLTDHNTTAGLAEMDALSAPDLLTAGGVELTTYWGHAVVLGARRWIDWRVRPGSGGMARLAAEAEARGGLFIIAHPGSPGDPACTGCAWRFGDMMPGAARLVEIWNGPWAGESNNEASLALWYDWLNLGYRLVATAGVDTHGPNDYAARPGFNVVWAEALAEPALLDGIRAGHLTLSSGPSLTLEAETDTGERAMAGDTIARPATLAARWQGCPPNAVLGLIANGRRLYAQRAGAAGEHRRPLAPADAEWVLAEVRAADGELLAITNPIFLEAADTQA
jgi:hypothetical protein